MSGTPSFMHSSLLVASGGGFGAWLRYLTSRAWMLSIGPVAASAFPWATLTANLAGSLAMGLLAGWMAFRGTGGESWRLLLGVGILGGYTTFSSFALELALFLERGAGLLALVYAAVSVVVGVLALFAGLALMRALLAGAVA